MEIKRVIIHNIEKEQNQKARIEYSNQLYDKSDNKCKKLLDVVYSSFKRTIKYGIFAETCNDAFHKKFDNYLKSETSSDEDFINFSKNVLLDLKTKMDTQSLSKGGYIIFAEITNMAESFFIIFVVRDKSGPKLSFQNNNMRIDEITHIDTDKLAMACRINLKAYQDKKDRYLSFLSTTQNEASKYFIDWLEVQTQKKDTEDTKKLRTIINQIDLPKDENGNEIPRDKLRVKVFDLCKVSQTVNIKALSETIWKDPDYIPDYAENKNIDINSEFSFDATELGKLKKYSINGDGIKLDFPPDTINTAIYIDPNNGDTLIIKSNALANSFRAEL